MGRLTDKVALITGTAGGQGRAAALSFAREGAKVVGCDLDAEGSRETVALVRAEGGSMVSMEPVDLGVRAEVEAWVELAVGEFGGVDILYNNAGAARFGPLAEQPWEDWLFTIRNELDIVFLATQVVWPHLVARGGGAILNTASVAGLHGSQTMTGAAHCAAKGGVIGLSRQMAGEGARHGIRVNCISPGVIITAATAEFLADPQSPVSRLTASIPLGRAGTTEDTASCALFLCSDEASYVTAANLVIDGGATTIAP